MSSYPIAIEDVRAKLETLFPMPQILARLLEALEDPDVNGATLENILKLDPSFSMKLLSLANSSYYGAAGKITNIRGAITLLGFNFIRSLAVQAGVASRYDIEIPGTTFTGRDLWKHSVGVAVCAKMLARRLKLGNAEDFFTVGILHDMGMIVEHHFYPDAFRAVLEAGANRRQPIEDCEHDLLMTDHAALTRLLGETWRLPTSLCQAAGHHHQPHNAPDEFRRASQALALADHLVMDVAFGYVDPYRHPLDPAVAQQLGVDDVDLDVLREDFAQDAARLADLVSS